MTEEEWLNCTEPTLMLKFLRDKVSDRKLRLYFCGGCGCLAPLLYDPNSIKAVGIVERFADNLANAEDMKHATWLAEGAVLGFDVWEGRPRFRMDLLPRLVTIGALSESALTGGEWQLNETICRRLYAAADLVYLITYTSYDEEFQDRAVARMRQIEWPGLWLRDCVFGNPFRPVSINLSWLTSTVVALAQGIYTDRAFDRMPILADALQDDGCENTTILDHCRDPKGVHARGCFVVDMLLGKT